MRLACFSTGESSGLALVRDSELMSLSDHIEGVGSDMVALIERWEEFRPRIEAMPFGADFALDEVVLEAPIRRPGKIMALGFNYADHAAEANIEIPRYQGWFTNRRLPWPRPSSKSSGPRCQKYSITRRNWSS